MLFRSLDAGAVLIMEVDGLDAGLDQDAEHIIEIAKKNNAREVRRANTEAERLLLWKSRKQAFGAGPTAAQYNHAVLGRGALRGLHCQSAPHSHGKLVWVVCSSAFHVLVGVTLVAGDAQTHDEILAGFAADGRDHLAEEPQQGRAIGFVSLTIYLLQHFRLQPQQPLILWHRRQHFGVQHNAVFLRHVVVHAVGINHAVSLAKDDVTFEVKLAGAAAGLEFADRGAIGGIDEWRPTNGPIRGKRHNPQLIESPHDHLKTGIDNANPFTLFGKILVTGIVGTAAAPRDADGCLSNRRGRHRYWWRNFFPCELRRTDGWIA